MSGANTSGSSVTFRPATEHDLAGEHSVFVSAQEELHHRRGDAWAGAPLNPEGRWARVHRHLLAHDGERAFVAKANGRIVGFTAAIARGDCWFLSALFIDPAHQGQGVGQQLLDRAWGGPYRRRVTITEAIQPVSNGLYARRGLLPVTPVLEFVGSPVIATGTDTLRPATPTPEALRAIDLAAYGFDRAVDHEFWMRTPARPTVWLRGDDPCAYSYSGGLYGVGPVAGRDPESAAQALRAELADQTGAEMSLAIPGTATALVRVALEAGLRFADPGLLLLSPPDVSPTAHTVHSYWLL